MIEIILLCRNRLDYAKEALTSLCKIDYKNLKITISDNSSSPLFRDRNFSSEFPGKNIRYIYRGGKLKATDHMITAAQESECDFFCLFHDDDIALPNFLSDRIKFFDDPSVICVGTNAYEMLGNLKTQNSSFKDQKNVIRINTSKNLLSEYFDIDKGSVAPFPGYIYRTKNVINLVNLLSSSAGKYSDSIFLAGLADHGQLVWSPKPAMYYRKHFNNDSNFESLKDRLGLLSLIKKILKKDSRLIADYRFSLYLIWASKSYVSKKKKRYIFLRHKKVKKFLILYALNNLHRLFKKLRNHFR